IGSHDGELCLPIFRDRMYSLESSMQHCNLERGGSCFDATFLVCHLIIGEKKQCVSESSQVAYVTFKDSQGAETALLLTGAGGIGSAVRKAENVVTIMLAKGFVLGKDALNKAKSFDERHQLTSTASAKVSDLDKRMGLSEKISMGTAAVNEKVMEMDQKYQVSEKTRSAIAAAEQKVSTAGAAIMKNRYVFTGASWVTGAFSKVARAASDVGTKAMDKAATEQEERHKVEEQLAKGHESGEDPTTASNDSPATASKDSSPAKHQDKAEPAQGSIL
ncbi:hypothetical protein BHE74_00044201, partial [Ensete ventricosum]